MLSGALDTSPEYSTSFHQCAVTMEPQYTGFQWPVRDYKIFGV
jgi:hypothetical protein